MLAIGAPCWRWRGHMLWRHAGDWRAMLAMARPYAVAPCWRWRAMLAIGAPCWRWRGHMLWRHAGDGAWVGLRSTQAAYLRDDDDGHREREEQNAVGKDEESDDERRVDRVAEGVLRGPRGDCNQPVNHEEAGSLGLASGPSSGGSPWGSLSVGGSPRGLSIGALSLGGSLLGALLWGSPWGSPRGLSSGALLWGSHWRLSLGGSPLGLSLGGLSPLELSSGSIHVCRPASGRRPTTSGPSSRAVA